MSFFTLIIFLLILSVIVVVHEFGHFIFARKFGVKVKEFGIGFPPRLIKLGRWWQTNFVLNLIPLGGYVNMAGENGINEHEGHQSATKKNYQFYQKKPWQRFIIIFAGPGVNFILSAIIFMWVYSYLGIPQKVENSVFIDGIEENSPAAQAKLSENTKIIALINQAGEKLLASNRDEVAAFIARHQGQNITIVTTGPCQAGLCESKEYPHFAYVRTDDEKPKNAGALGVALSEFQLFFYPWYQQIPLSVYHGSKQSIWMAQEMLGGLAQGLASLFKQEKSDLVMMGPVGIVSELNKQKTFQEGFLAIIQFAGLLSLNLGVINLLPIPALDGGRLILIIIEKFIGRKKVSKVESGLNYLGFMFIIALSVLVTGQDIWRIFKGG